MNSSNVIEAAESVRIKSRIEIKAWLIAQVAKILEIERSQVSTNRAFSEFGIQSIVAFSMTGELCEWVGMDLSATLLWEHNTINNLSGYISEQLLHENVARENDEKSSILLAGDNEEKLFCICGLGLYQRLAEELASGMQTYGVYIAPEKELGKVSKDIENSYNYLTVEALAERYVEEIMFIKPYGPYNLLGLSFGGILAFEVAQQLARRGEEVGHLVLLDSVLPNAVTTMRYKLFTNFIKNIFNEWYQGDKEKNTQQETLSYREMSDYQGLYYWKLAQRYISLPYNGSVLLVRAADATLFGRGYLIEDNLGWTNMVVDGLDVVQVPGTHTGILQDPHVTGLARALSERICSCFV